MTTPDDGAAALARADGAGIDVCRSDDHLGGEFWARVARPVGSTPTGLLLVNPSEHRTRLVLDVEADTAALVNTIDAAIGIAWREALATTPEFVGWVVYDGGLRAAWIEREWDVAELR